ncbi:MAG: hypothetical protein ACRBB4_15725 [Neptuniibacter sp.]
MIQLGYALTEFNTLSSDQCDVLGFRLEDMGPGVGIIGPGVG